MANFDVHQKEAYHTYAVQLVLAAQRLQCSVLFEKGQWPDLRPPPSEMIQEALETAVTALHALQNLCVKG